jgi:hypothetical protein
MGKRKFNRSAWLKEQRIPAFVTRALMEGPKPKTKPARKTKSISKAQLKD